MTATKIQPGDDTHLTLLMAPHSLNFVTGADRAALLAYGRDVFAAARDSKCLAQIEEPAGAAPAAVAPQGERQWICPTRTVADLVNNLLTMDQALPIYGAQYIEKDGRRCAIAVPPTVSRERVKDGRWIGQGEELNAAVVWTRAEQPVATPGLTDGQLDDESYRVNDEPGFADAFRAGARFAERVHGVTASAARAVTGKADWWRGRADEIEVRVARSGSQEAMRCYTDMRTLLQAAAPALEAPAAPAAPMPWTNARQPHDPKIQDGYMESDLAWCRRNRDAVTWLIDNQAEIRAALAGVPQAPAAAGIDQLLDALSQHDDPCDDIADAINRVRVLRAEADCRIRAENTRVDRTAHLSAGTPTSVVLNVLRVALDRADMRHRATGFMGHEIATAVEWVRAAIAAQAKEGGE
ncbi:MULTISPECIES: hypothetical protein [Delftia]|uniref:hypothetical protein n=1 Tax=Delftia TaxID=80865 RepID=UPI00034E0E28|nr:MULTISPECIES: hypothetical protein [Delftia]EPD35851.1 hypothetical protein HMPREF9702_05758 [Delftia acidovorans CCUG 15835]